LLHSYVTIISYYNNDVQSIRLYAYVCLSNKYEQSGENMSVKDSFATRLKKLREDNGLSQTDLADKIGISRGSISFYEKGSRTPDIEILDKVSRYFNVPLEYLMGYVATTKRENIEIDKALGLSDHTIEVLEYASQRPSFSAMVLLHTINLLIGNEDMRSSNSEDETDDSKKGLQILSDIAIYLETVPIDGAFAITANGNIVAKRPKQEIYQEIGTVQAKDLIQETMLSNIREGLITLRAREKSSDRLPY